MLHMVVIRHSPESCPSHPQNREAFGASMGRMLDLAKQRGAVLQGSWAEPPAHLNYLLVDAPSAHAVAEAFMESGLMGHTQTEVHPVLPAG